MNEDTRRGTNLTLALAVGVALLAGRPAAGESLDALARSNVDTLRLSTYATAGSVDTLLHDAKGREAAMDLFVQFGITKLYVEVYRGGRVVREERLREVRRFFSGRGIEVVGGIATVPGGNFGVRQKGRLGWFNWENAKTQDDLKEVVEMAARVFDEFIIDDFLCTDDISEESNAARGQRQWSDYRRDLLSDLSQRLFIDPARAVNPGITMIIKYPQWYDRFHLFGYDVVREPALFDKVWVGTETRGAYTQRYGFVQPYEGFVNYRWLAALSGSKIGGAWFDHGDCDGDDFIEQAYQTVLAGAPEIVLFNYNNLVQGHAGHDKLKTDFPGLVSLAKLVKENPVWGVAAYKPPHSDAGGDLYIMDFVGMLGVPLIPYPKFPDNERVIFLPTQAAADPGVAALVERAVRKGATVIMTAGFLSSAADGRSLAALAGVDFPFLPGPLRGDGIAMLNQEAPIAGGLDLAVDMSASRAQVVLEGLVGGRRIPFLTRRTRGGATVAVLNVHTFSQADFDAVGEVLLCPRPLGLLDIPEPFINELRRVFNEPLAIDLKGPNRIVMQPIGKDYFMMHNYNKEAVQFVLGNFGDAKTVKRHGDAQTIALSGERLTQTMSARSRSLFEILN